MSNILLLEDDLVLGETIFDLFELNNFTITWLKDGKVALEEIYENSFDLLLLDINVPYINGFELLENLRQNNDTTPAIFITAKIDIESFKKGFELGADDYIKKPFDFEELLIKVKAIIRKTKQQNIIYDDLYYNTDSKILIKDNQIIHLTPSELALFEYFVSNQERVIESYELLEVTNSTEFKSDTLRVWISKLKKIGLKITNIRGVGYRCEKI